ncbi:X-Pro dipeptidyl-peptidase-domain-containing protein [Ochromonadaceae sp. CCMP2298]|nr:X-Pro dipeptidyl-peptidase-domain-containing protein [Ochromonadaceae sp. CCMP2298]
MMLLALLASLAPALALVPDGSRTFEEMLPARDGVKLHTRVVLPRNYEGKKFTAIMDRSPYGYGGLEWFTDLFMPAGFVAVGQDMRGTEKSEGLFSIWHSDADDSQDLGDWVVQQPWSNGEIYTFGASADGLGAFTTVHNSPAWLKAQYFIWTSSIGYDVFYPGGALLQELVDSWIHGTVEGGWGDECYEEIKKNEMRTEGD